MGPFNAGPYWRYFLRLAEIRAGVKGAGVKRVILKRKIEHFGKVLCFQNRLCGMLRMSPFD